MAEALLRRAEDGEEAGEIHAPREIEAEQIEGRIALLAGAGEVDPGHGGAGPDLVDPHLFQGIGDLFEERSGERLALFGVAVEVLRLHGLGVEGEGEIVIDGPGVLRQEREAGVEIALRGRVRGGGLGLAAGAQVKARALVALGDRSARDGAEGELVGDVEEARFALILGRGREEQAADAEVDGVAILAGDERVRGLLHAVVEEAEGRGDAGIGAGPLAFVEREDEAFHQGFVEIGGGLGRGLLAHDGERREIEAVADAGRKLQGSAGLRRELLDLARHQLDHAAGEAAAADGVEVPAPGGRARIEVEELVLVERGEELAEEEGIAARALEAEPRKRDGTRAIAAERVGDELLHVGRAQRPEREPRGAGPGALELLREARERVRRGHLALAVGADHQQVADLRRPRARPGSA
ncbi:MAG: hypothetical protein QM820_22820 [Minicystis sp.]